MSNSSLTNSVRFALATASLAQLHAQLAAQFRRQDKNHDGGLSPREFLAPPG